LEGLRHMRRGWVHLIPFVVFGTLLAACGANRQAEQVFTATMEVTVAQDTPTQPPTLTASPTVTSTATPEPTATPTQAPRISVSENTNCREGPAVNYLFQGVLEVGDSAEVLARGSEPDYWYIVNPQKPGEGCWLWGEYGQVEGDVEALPVYTPQPSPTPAVGFEVSVKSFESCGSTFYVVFGVKNNGGTRLWSGYVKVENTDTHEVLYNSPERHPFAELVQPVCPPGHGNELWPGETRYIHAPLSSVISGDNALGTITLCDADWEGGTCVTQYSYFQLP
jgi:hypothetical protein